MISFSPLNAFTIANFKSFFGKFNICLPLGTISIDSFYVETIISCLFSWFLFSDKNWTLYLIQHGNSAYYMVLLLKVYCYGCFVVVAVATIVVICLFSDSLG